MSTILFSGDSNTVGNAMTSGTPYSTKMATDLGFTANNQAVSGTRAMDQSYIAQDFGSGDVNCCLIGTNCSGAYGLSSTKLAIWKKMLRSTVLLTSGFNYTSGYGMTLSGSWADADTQGSSHWGMYSTGAASATKVVNGTQIAIGFIQTTDASFDCPITVTITDSVHGTVTDTFTLSGSTDGVTGFSANYGTITNLYTGLTSENHTVTVSTTSSTKSIGMQYVMGNGKQPLKKPFLLFTLPKKLAYISPDSSTNNANYASTTSDVCTELKSFGLNIGLVDINGATGITSSDYVSGDNIHLNDSGQGKVRDLAEPVLYALPGTSGGGGGATFPTGTVTKTLNFTYTCDGAGGITGPYTVV